MRRRLLGLVLTIVTVQQLPTFALATWWLRELFGPAGGVSLAIVWMLAANVPLGLRLRHFRAAHRAHPLSVWLLETPWFAFFNATLAFFVLAPVALVAWLALSPFVPALPGLRASLTTTWAVAFALGVYGTFVRRLVAPVREVRIAVPGLSPALEGYRIVQYSDVHCGPDMPRSLLTHLAQRGVALAPDLVVLTGDMISHGDAYLPDITHLTRSLSARDGVFACLGNHDYFGDPTAKGVVDAMRAGGATVLRNEGLTLRSSRGANLHVCAVDDTWTRRADVTLALAEAPTRGAGVPVVMLAHDPMVFDEIAHTGGADLVLSGHTHAGQLAVPFAVARWNLARLRYRYSAGYYQSDGTHLYVHAGNGTTGPPSRFGAAPEIAVLTLVRA